MVYPRGSSTTGDFTRQTAECPADSATPNELAFSELTPKSRSLAPAVISSSMNHSCRSAGVTSALARPQPLAGQSERFVNRVSRIPSGSAASSLEDPSSASAKITPFTKMKHEYGVSSPVVTIA